MDENALTALLLEASDEVAERGFDPADDLRRGRTARRGRRHAATAAALLGTAAAVAVALALSGQLAGRPESSVTPASNGPALSTTVAAASAPPTNTTSATVATTGTPTSVTSPATPEPFALPPGARDFLRMVFGVAQDHLDPAHERLQWTEGFTGGGGLNTREWGQKFGWQAANDPGQAIVYAAVGDKAAV
ncbi:MAG TPA: hypothetical protein VNC23_09440, partial [Lapillicoccus sp.]|nr:hypothetical protein [Lapillicoccus sp.]